jgi:hypothetical protein
VPGLTSIRTERVPDQNGAPQEIRTPARRFVVQRTQTGRRGNARSGPLITIESSHRGQPRRFYAATFLPPLPRTKSPAKIRVAKSPRKRNIFKGLMSGCGDPQPSQIAISGSRVERDVRSSTFSIWRALGKSVRLATSAVYPRVWAKYAPQFFKGFQNGRPNLHRTRGSTRTVHRSIRSPTALSLACIALAEFCSLWRTLSGLFQTRFWSV